MALSATHSTLDRYAEIGDLATSVRILISKAFLPLAIILSGETAVLWFSGHPGAMCFALVSAGTLLVLNVWRKAGAGLPIIPMLALQNLIAYGLPVVVSNETIMGYPSGYLTDAGIEMLVFSCSLAAVWRCGMSGFHMASPLCYALQGFNDEKMSKLSRLGFRLATSATLYALLSSFHLLDFLLAMLPAGSNSILNVLVSAVSACGFFLSAMMLGKGVMPPLQRIAFWAMLWLNCYIEASGFLLSATTTLFFSVLIGFFWSTGRMPWRFLLVVVGVLSFFNLGKFEMRDRYWARDGGDGAPDISFLDMPSYYQQWTVASYDALVGAEDASYHASRNSFATQVVEKKSGQNLFDRVNNLQNLLFVIEAMGPGHIPALGGATYTLIPPLLVPRILWPDKPRSHEGQVLLNVHFGRQDLNSTFQTYVAWGLQAEAYGNFGPITGNIVLGAVIGLIFAWTEKFVARKLLLSMEGFLAFTFFLGMANSYEMVASVLVTSIFQSFFPVIIASLPFVEQVVPHRSESIA